MNLADPGGHAWISGTAVKVAAAAKNASKPGVMRSGAATAVKNATKKVVTSTKNTASTSSQKSKGSSKQNLSKDVKTASTKQHKAVTSSSKSSGSSSAKKGWESAATGRITGTAASVVRRLTPGHSYINNKLFTASSAKERKLCSNAGRAKAGVKPTTATVAPAIPGVFEGLGALLSALGGALAGAVEGVVSSAILPVVLVVAVAVLGVGIYKYLTEEKVALTPTIAEQILEMARKRKEEQETISDSSGGYDTINPDKSEINTGGEGSGNNNDNNEEESEPKDPKPEEPKPENNSAGSENVPESSGSIESEIEDSLWEPAQNKNNLWSKGKLKEHFEKHGGEFGVKSAQEYSDMAVKFGTQKSNNIVQTIYEGFVYRYDLVTNTVFVGTLKGGKVKTFYIWDGRATDFVINLLKSLGLIK